MSNKRLSNGPDPADVRRSIRKPQTRASGPATAGRAFRQTLSHMRNAIHIALLRRAAYEPERYKARLGFALAISFAIHALILSLRFGMPGLGLPGVALPWAERRAHSSDLTAHLVEAPRPLPPLAPMRAPRPLAAHRPAVHPAPVPELIRPALPQAETPIVAPPVAARVELPPPAIEPEPPPRPQVPAPVPAPAKSEHERSAPNPPQPEILAQTDPQQETFAVPPPAPDVPEQQAAPPVEVPPLPAKNIEPPEVATTKQAEEAAIVAEEQERALQKRVQEEAALRAKEQEAARQRAQETVRQRTEETAKRQADEAARLAQALEAQRKVEEAARQREEETARHREVEEARQRDAEAARRQETEAARARELAERQKAQDLAAAERERAAAAAAAARAAPADGEGSRPADTRSVAGPISGRDMAAKALEALRAPDGRAYPQQPPPSSLPNPSDTRRRSIIGSAKVDITLRMYVDSWRWKVERNGNLYYPASARAKGLENPIVTTSIRSDGSLEQVVINRSSGMREADEAVQRIAQLYAPYSAFPPALAREFDVIEIRRIWSFGDSLRILEEM